MRHNGFGLRISNVKDDEKGYVKLQHKQLFSIVLENDTTLDADAEVFVDGKPVGTIRVNLLSSVVLDRPVNENGRFMAIEKDTQEAQSLGITGREEESGLIKVVFHPGYQRKIVNTFEVVHNKCNYGLDHELYHDCAAMRGIGEKGIVSGGVGLSGRSDQSFRTVDDLIYDGYPTTLYLRIVFEKDNLRPIRPIGYTSPYPRPL